jgi:hypothetical protein
VYQFLSIKYVLFISYIQGVVLQVLASTGIIHDYQGWTVTEIITAISAALTCVEMAIASLLHVLAFPHTEFVPVDAMTRKPPLFTACLDLCRPDDLWHDAVVVIKSILGWVGLPTGFRRVDTHSSSINGEGDDEELLGGFSDEANWNGANPS